MPQLSDFFRPELEQGVGTNLLASGAFVDTCFGHFVQGGAEETCPDRAASSVDVSTERGVGFGTAVSLTFEPLTAGSPTVARSYDLMPDGSILGTMPEGGDIEFDSNRIVVVENWFEELERLVPTP